MRVVYPCQDSQLSRLKAIYNSDKKLCVLCLEGGSEESGNDTSDGTGAGDEASSAGARRLSGRGSRLLGCGGNTTSLAGRRQNGGSDDGGRGGEGVVGGDSPVRRAGGLDGGGVGSRGGNEAAGSRLRHNSGAVSRAVGDVRAALSDGHDMSGGRGQGSGRLPRVRRPNAGDGSGESEKSGGTHIDD